VSVRIALSPYGGPAFEQLRGLIDEAKGDDPLAPVTVVVARGAVGLGVRRALASGVSPNGRRGVANVSFVTLAGLAETLAGSALAEGGRRPLTDAVLRAAMVAALSGAAGPLLGPARDHPSTVDALLQTYRELRAASDTALDALSERSPRATDVVSVLRAVRERTMEWYDDVDTLNAAVLQVEGPAGVAVGRAGPLVLFLPTALTPPAARLVRALAAKGSCTAIVGVTGDAHADGLARQLVESLQPGLEPTIPAMEVRGGDFVLSAPTSDAEVLLVLRDLMARFEAGTPLERMAIAHSGSLPYVTLLHNMLREAGIPFNGGGARALSSTVAGRTILGALQLPDHDWRREDVVEWLHSGPIVQHGRSVPSTRWDVLSAECGISEGLEQWHARLAARADALRAEAARGNGGSDDDVEPWRHARLADAERCLDLQSFIEEMAARLGECPSTWETWAKWARSLLARLVGGSSAMDEWPAEERAAVAAVEEAMDRLSHLDELDAAFSPAESTSALMAELSVPAPQTTRFGSGVWVTPVGAVAGLRVDVLYVVGMNDGAFPGRPADDVLIPDRERADVHVDASLPLRGTRATAMRRDYLAALAGAGTVRLSFPRGNQRDGRELRPSRWVLDTLGNLVSPGQRLYSGDLEDLVPTGEYQVEPSYMASVGAPGAPMSLLDRDTRTLLEWTSSRHTMAAHDLCRDVPHLGRGVQLTEGRAGGFTRFNGNIGRQGDDSPLVPPLLSATRLETFASCPRHYFLESVLQVVPRPEAERLLSTDRMEYGSLVHRILERFVRPLIGLRPGEGPDDQFSEERLTVIAEEELHAFEADGLAAPGAAWQVERVRLLRELRMFAAADLAWRVRQGVVTEQVEHKFGYEGSAPVAVDVPGRQPVHFRGIIDRVDVTPDGRKVVTDYKTGGPRRYLKIGEDHFQEGSTVQLPVYALAAGANESEVVTSEYWCVSEHGEFGRFGFPVASAEVAELSNVVGVLADAMDNAHFPANPGGSHRIRSGQCAFCPYDGVCPTDRQRSWDQVKRDPALARLVELVEPS
jgi:ATP-dependent helicase/nuclease subunit B